MGDAVTDEDSLVIAVFVPLTFIFRIHIEIGSFQVILCKTNTDKRSPELLQMLRSCIHCLVVVLIGRIQGQ